MSITKHHFTVVGAGTVGVCTALYLLRDGHRVTLLDRLAPGMGCSFGNGGLIPGGWPNGRRFGDDVVDIAVSALLSDLRGPLVIRVADGVDGVSANDMPFNKVFPYEATPQNGRNHTHP